jgi:hypothetical protein
VRKFEIRLEEADSFITATNIGILLFSHLIAAFINIPPNSYFFWSFSDMANGNFPSMAEMFSHLPPPLWGPRPQKREERGPDEPSQLVTSTTNYYRRLQFLQDCQ